MSTRTRLMMGAALSVLLAFQGSPEAAQKERVRVDFQPVDICYQSSWFPIAIRPSFDGTSCVSSIGSGGLVWLNLPPDQFPDVKFSETFLVPSAPPGVTGFGLQQLNHLLVAYLFEQGGIAVAAIADNGDVPPAPSFVEGEILGQIAYGMPFEVSVHAKLDRHEFRVLQGGVIIALAEVEKANPHADPFTYVNYFINNAPRSSLEWVFGSAGFRGVIPSDGSGPFFDGPVLGALSAERAGNAIRVVND